MLSGDSMVWQANSDWYFRMASGYISAEVPPDFFHDPVVANMLGPDGSGPIARQNLPVACGTSSTATRSGPWCRAVAGAWWEGVLDEMHLRKDQVGGVVL